MDGAEMGKGSIRAAEDVKSQRSVTSASPTEGAMAACQMSALKPVSLLLKHRQADKLRFHFNFPKTVLLNFINEVRMKNIAIIFIASLALSSCTQEMQNKISQKVCRTGRN